MSDKKIDFDKPASPAEGTWPCTVSSATYGEQTDKQGKPTGRIVARVNVTLDAGPDKGRSVSYEDEVTAKSSLYVGRSLKAVGWKERSLSTIEADCAEWIKKTGGKSTVEIRHIEIKKGKRYDEWCEAWYADHEGSPPPLIWPKANSIGRGPRPLAAPSVDALSDADEQMRRAMAEDGGGGAPDDTQQQGRDPDDIPFISCAVSDGTRIAKVLR
jgi:hypothetical protein